MNTVRENFSRVALMGYVYNFLYDHPVLSLAMLALSIGMTVDVFHRGVEPFWYWIIWVVPLAGPLIYFFVHPGPEWLSKLGPLFHGGPSLDELRHRVRQSPTLANQLALGQALIGRKEYAEAAPLLEEARKVEPDHGQVLYGLAVCYVRLETPRQAIPILERIMQKDPRWGDDQAGVLLVEIHQELGEPEVALRRARDLVKQAPTLKHKCLLAELLAGQGGAQEARTMLEQALADHAYLPAPLRRRNRVWAGQAKRILRTLR
jgi:hypothetical protein